MQIVERHDILEEVLETWSGALGTARDAYRGHAYRVFNCARWLVGDDRHDRGLVVASAFHDLGIWSDATFDYLAPSEARARDFVAARASGVDPEMVGAVIAHHHKLRAYRGADAEAVEAFRRADLVDVSRGWIRAGLDRGRWRELVAVFPFAGFHGLLVRTALAWTLRHPLRPLPMLRA